MKKKPEVLKKKIFDVTLDVYSTIVKVYCGYEGKEVWEEIHHNHNIDMKAKKWVEEYVVKKECARTVSLYGKGGGVLLMFEHSPSVHTVAHEVFHAVSFVMRRVGIPFTSSTEEAWAYAMDRLVEQIVEELEKKETKKK